MADASTVLYLCGKVIMEEYGRQGTIAVTPRAYTRKTLVLRVDSTLWAQEVWMRRDLLIKCMNRKCGGPYIEKIAVTAE